MFRLFTDQVPNPNRNIVFPAWRYINEKIQQNLAVLIRYYRSVEEPIPNQNIIARILNDTFIDPTLDTLTYVEEVEKSKDRLNQYGIVSNRNLGHVFNKGYTGSNEMFYSVQNQLFLYNISSTWRKLVPLRMVYTNNSNLDYEIRYGKMVSKDYTIFEIDYVKLMVMYKEWCLNRMQSRFEINPNTFISQYVFPNMLTESINIILFSRLIDRFYNVDNQSIQLDCCKNLYSDNLTISRVDLSSVVFGKVLMIFSTSNLLFLFSLIKRLITLSISAVTSIK